MKKLTSLLLALVLLIGLMPQPSFAELKVGDTGTITVTKQVINGSAEGITYTITQTHTIDDNGNFIAIPSDETAYTATATTTANGQALFSDVPVGRYTVQETAVPDGVILNNTVYTVDLPQDPSQSGNYTASVAFKDSSSFIAEKTQRPGISGDFKIYDEQNPMQIMRETPFQYQLSTTVPSDIKGGVNNINGTPVEGVTNTNQLKYNSIVFADTLDPKLELIEDSIVVTNETTTLVSGADYTIGSGDQFIITITSEGIEKLTANTPLNVVFNVQISETADMSTNISNTFEATYNYTNADGTENTSGSMATAAATWTTLPTNTLTVNKVDSTDNTKLLAGAIFELRKEGFDNDGNAVPGDLVATATTPEGTVDGETLGVINFQNLAPGNYYLVETKAPDGYNELLEPIPVVVTENGDNTVTVQNVPTAVMPGTGGLGPIAYSIIGVVAVIFAFYVILGAKKKKQEETVH